MADVLYSGGPCSGKHVSVADEALADGRIYCGGMNYKAYEVYQGEWLALPPTHAAPKAVTANSPQAAHAWKHLVRALAIHVPNDYRETVATRRRMLRAARR